jgi:hypothetical protein
MAYRLELSPSLPGVHNVFHVSQLKKCLKPPAYVVIDNAILLKADLSYPEHPVKLLGQQDRVIRWQMIHFYKV